MTEQPDVHAYMNCMTHVRDRVNFIAANMRGTHITGNHYWDVEIIFLQFRRVLELIGFSSIAANLDLYAATQEKYRIHYNARLMLRDVGKVNPGFYPQPMTLASEGPEKARAAYLTDGFLTKDDFIKLYDVSSSVLHAANPWSENPKIEFGYTVEEWVNRIQRLLTVHTVVLAGNTQRWMIVVPATGAPHLAVTTPLTEAQN